MHTVFKVVDRDYRSAWASDLGIYARHYYIGTTVRSRSTLFPLFVFTSLRAALNFQACTFYGHEKSRVLLCKTRELLHTFPLFGSTRIYSMNNTIAKAIWYASRNKSLPPTVMVEHVAYPSGGTAWCRNLKVVEEIRISFAELEELEIVR